MEACTTGAKVASVELCNGEDDDCDGVLDEDAANCDRPNRPGRCVFGACVSDGCDPGFGDCNHNPDDGCERALGPCKTCDEACLSHMVLPQETPAIANVGASGAAAPVITTTAANGGARPPAVDTDLDAGVDIPPVQVADAGSKPTNPTKPVDECANVDSCTRPPQDCALLSARCTCRASEPTGQGPDCDSCACEQCQGELNDCMATLNQDWNTTCRALTRCFGDGRARGVCTRNNCSDVCQDEYVASSGRFGVLGDLQCSFGSCNAFQTLRQSCYASKCAAVCKF